MCSIVGYMPIGFCCSYCILCNEKHTCLHTESKPESTLTKLKKELKLVSAEIKKDLLLVVIEQDGKEFPLNIDIRKYFKSKE